MATYYVSPTGNNGNTGTGPGDGDAWAGLDYAINTGTPTGTHTINVAAGTYAAETWIRFTATVNNKTLSVVGTGTPLFSGNNSTALFYSSVLLTAFDITFNGIEFVNTVVGVNSGLRLDAACTAIDIAFNDCTFSTHANNTHTRLMVINAASGATTRNISYTGGSFVGKGATNVATLSDCGDITIDGMTITQPAVSSTNHIFSLQYTQKKVVISNCNITSSGGYACFVVSSGGTAVTALESVIYSGNTISGGSGFQAVGISGVAYHIYMYDNTHTGILLYGAFIGANTNETIADLGYVYVSNNTFVKSSAEAGHGLLLGKGVIAGQVSDNFVDVTARATEWAIVIKATNATVTNNICLGGQAMLAKGAQNVTFSGNTCMTNENWALQLLNDPASSPNPEKVTSGCLFTNNIFDGSGGVNAVNISVDTELYDCVFDYNDYWGASSTLFLIAAASSTYEEAKTFWSTNGTYKINKENMANSLNVNPQLDIDYKTTNPEVRDGGKPDANGDSTSMGAIRASGTGGGFFVQGGFFQ